MYCLKGHCDYTDANYVAVNLLACLSLPSVLRLAVANGCHCLCCSIEHEDLSDDEVWESVQDEVNEEEEEVGGASKSSKTGYQTPDSDLSPAARLSAYDSHAWRLEVREIVTMSISKRLSYLPLSQSVRVCCMCGRCVWKLNPD